MDSKTLLEHEERLARLFTNSRKNNRLANCYLLYGKRNAPLKECALFLAKSLNCETSLLACDNCPSCKRFDNKIRPDFVLIDGSKNTIKKEDIKELENKFSLSAYEKGHRLCYVINHIENITDEAANALLKFLEEPKEGQVAFLTSTNTDKVLKTILSRSLSIRVDPIDPDKFMNEILEYDFTTAKKGLSVSATQAYMLSRLFASMEEVIDTLTSDDSFKNGFDAAEFFINDLSVDYRQACFTLLKQTQVIKDSKCYNWMYLTLDEYFSSILRDEISDSNPNKDILKILSKNKDCIQKGEDVIKMALTYKNINLNPTSVCAKLLMTIYNKE